MTASHLKRRMNRKDMVSATIIELAEYEVD